MKNYFFSSLKGFVCNGRYFYKLRVFNSCMKILVIGDFHGKFSNRQLNYFKKVNPDLIFSVGDFCGSEKWVKLFFKHFYAKNKKELRKIPKEIKKELEKYKREATDAGIRVLKKLKEFGKPFFTVHGNWDPSTYGTDIGNLKEDLPKKSELKKFHKVEEKGFEFVDFKVKDFGGFVLVGGTAGNWPARIDKKSLERTLRKRKEDDPKEKMRRINSIKKDYLKKQKMYIKNFKQAKKLKKPIIFLTHNSPYGTKLDVIRDKKASKLARGKHYGSYLERLMINRFKPDLVLCGHLHENFGKQTLGKTLVVNTGTVFQREYVIVHFNEKTKTFKVALKKQDF